MLGISRLRFIDRFEAIRQSKWKDIAFDVSLAFSSLNGTLCG